jgi:hypothetical protein
VSAFRFDRTGCVHMSNRVILAWKRRVDEVSWWVNSLMLTSQLTFFSFFLTNILRWHVAVVGSREQPNRRVAESSQHKARYSVEESKAR